MTDGLASYHTKPINLGIFMAKAAPKHPAKPTKTKTHKPSAYISNPIDLFAPSWKAIKANIGGLLKIYAFALIIPMLLIGIATIALVLTVIKVGISTMVVVLALFILAILVFLIALSPATNLALLDSVRGKTIKVGPTFRESVRLAPTVLGAAILTGLAVLGGLILFIIPGLIFAAWFSLSTYVIVDQKVGALEGMKRSKALVNKHVIEMWGLYSVAGAIGILKVVPLLGDIAAAGLTIAFTAAPTLRYLQLKELSEGEAEAPATHWANYALIVLGLIGGSISTNAEKASLNSNFNLNGSIQNQDNALPTSNSLY